MTQPILIRRPEDLDKLLPTEPHRDLLVRVAGQRTIHAKVSRRALRNLWKAVPTLFVWARPHGQDAAIVEIDAANEGSLEGRVIG